MKIKISQNDNLPEGEYELTDPSKLQKAFGDLSYGRSDREKLIEYDRIAGRVVKNDVVLPPQSLWKIERGFMNKSIEEFTDEELLSVVRRAENTNIPGSLYQRCAKELDVRNQKKTLEVSSHNKSWYEKPIGIIILAVAATLIGACLISLFGLN